MAVVHWDYMAILTYTIGPVLAIFPKPWRMSLPFAKKIRWERATAASGFAEGVFAVVALMYWYIHAMSIWVGNGVGVALSGKSVGDVRIQDIGGAALVVWWMHPVTWTLAYFGIEGAIRMCSGAFGDLACGIFPLFLADKIVFGMFRLRGRPANPSSNVSSYAGAIRDRIRVATLPEVPDELCFTKSESGEILEISASRKKQDWNPPRVVRFEGCFYRLETDSNVGGARPFRYQLRPLPAGVSGRTVLLYAPVDAIVRNVRTT